MKLKIEVKTSGLTSWTEITSYVKAGSWGNESLAGEVSHGEFVSGGMSFTLDDTDATLGHGYWFTALATSTSLPELRVQASYGDPDSIAWRTIFYGKVLPGRYAKDTDALLTLEATGLLGLADLQDMYPAASGQGVTERYSGRASTLLTTALRKIGCAAGIAADVDVKDWDAGSAQSDFDFNHALRQWTDNTVNPDTDYGVSALVPAGSNGVIAGFILRGGRLYRVDRGTPLPGDVTLTEVVDGDGKPYTTAGYKLLRCTTTAGTPCIAVVDARLRRSYSMFSREAEAFRYIDPAVTLGTVGLGLTVAAGVINPLVGALVGLGLAGATMAAKSATMTHKAQANRDQLWTALTVRVLSIGDGSNGAGGVGRGYNRTVTPVDTLDPIEYCTADSFCSDGANRLYHVRARPGNADGHLPAYYIVGNTAISGPHNLVHTTGTRKILSMPTGGAAAQDGTVCWGTADGYALAYLSNESSWWVFEGALDRPMGRFCGVIPYRSSDNLRYLAFIIANGSGSYIDVKVRDADGVRRSDADMRGGGAEETVQAVANAPDQFGIYAAAEQPVIFSTTTEPVLPVIYGYVDANGRPVTKAGGLYSDIGGTEPGAPELRDTYCSRPLPNGGDWRPPLLWKDGAAKYRVLTQCQSRDGAAALTDWYYSDRYAIARIHHDFKRDRMSIGAVLRESAKAFNLYLRILDPAGPGTAADVKIASRHAWTPTSIGTLDADAVAMNPRIDGIVYYDGAVADVQGVRVEGGSIGVGKTTFQLSSAFLVPNWARLLCADIPARYPRTSADYPYGRRVFVPRIHLVDNGVVDWPPSLTSDLFKRVAVSFLTGLDTSALVQQIGIDPGAAQFPARLLEYSVTAGVGDGVTWTSNASTESYTDADALTQESVTVPTTITGAGGPVYTWRPQANVIESQELPSPEAHVYALRVWLPESLTLYGYGYGMSRAGEMSDGALFCCVYSDADGEPGVVYEDSYALVYPNVATAGWNVKLLDTDAGFAVLPRGWCWIVVCVDSSDISKPVTVAPPIDWLQAEYAGRGFARRFKPGVAAGFVAEWPTDPVPENVGEVPALYLVGG